MNLILSSMMMLILTISVPTMRLLVDSGAIFFSVLCLNMTVVQDGVGGHYQSVAVAPGAQRPAELTPRELPVLTVYGTGNAQTDLTTDSVFMFILIHELGHAFGLEDTYTSSSDGNTRTERAGSLVRLWQLITLALIIPLFFRRGKLSS